MLSSLTDESGVSVSYRTVKGTAKVNRLQAYWPPTNLATTTGTHQPHLSPETAFIILLNVRLVNVWRTSCEAPICAQSIKKENVLSVCWIFKLGNNYFEVIRWVLILWQVCQNKIGSAIGIENPTMGLSGENGIEIKNKSSSAEVT